jgi:hypothetical protein
LNKLTCIVNYTVLADNHSNSIICC